MRSRFLTIQEFVDYTEGMSREQVLRLARMETTTLEWFRELPPREQRNDPAVSDYYRFLAVLDEHLSYQAPIDSESPGIREAIEQTLRGLSP